MIDLPTFRLRAPEFNSADDGLVQAMLDEAAAELLGAVDDWGTLIGTAHRLLTADKLWSSPFGSTMRLDGGNEKDEPSRYAIQLEKLHHKAFASALVL